MKLGIARNLRMYLLHMLGLTVHVLVLRSGMEQQFCTDSETNVFAFNK